MLSMVNHSANVTDLSEDGHSFLDLCRARCTHVIN